MQSVGTRLREARIKKGYTLEDIHARTRISLKNLTAIESDELSKISSPFTYRSFVRQVATLLDLDYEALSSHVQEASGTMPEPLVPGQEEALPVRPSQYPQPKPKRRLSWVYRTASIAAIAGAISCYLIFRNGGIQAAKLPASILPASRQVKTTDQPELTQPAGRIERSRIIPVGAPVGVPKAAAQPVRRQSSLVRPGTEQLLPRSALILNPSTASSPAPGSPGQSTASDVEVAAIHIELSANEPVWLSIVADGKTAYAGVLDAMHTKILNGRESARIRTGNAGGVNIIFNGRALGPMGRRGQSRTFVFTKNGYEVVQGAANFETTRLDPNGE
jgi:cytoskeleton protein RodZ